MQWNYDLHRLYAEEMLRKSLRRPRREREDPTPRTSLKRWRRRQ